MVSFDAFEKDFKDYQSSFNPAHQTFFSPRTDQAKLFDDHLKQHGKPILTQHLRQIIQRIA